MLFKGLILFLSISTIVCKEIDLAFILSSSSTSPKQPMPVNPSDFMKNLVQSIYSNFTISAKTTHIALITSGQTSKIVFDFNTYKDTLSLNQVFRTAVTLPNERSNVAKALNLANYGLFGNSARQSASKILLIIGQEPSLEGVSTELANLKNNGVQLLFIGVGNGLKNVGSPMKQYDTVFGDFNSFTYLIKTITEKIRNFAKNDTQPSFISETEKDEDKGSLCNKKCEKMVNKERIEINCNNCKLAGCCHLCCKDHSLLSGPIQLGFLLDESGELMNWNNFQSLKGFLKNLSHNFDTSNKKTKLGIITFSRDNIQIHDLRFYHGEKQVDNEIDKLNYDGPRIYAGGLNKGLDSSQSSFFYDITDLSVPRILLVFDSDSVKNDETEVKSFKLRSSDIQTFCIGLGSRYNKDNCGKMVDKPVEKHSMTARVNQLSELKDTITLMIVNDIAEKYCQLCAQGENDACRPCINAKHYLGDDSGFQNVKPSHILKIMNSFNKDINQYMKMKSSENNVEEEDNEDDDNHDDDTSNQVATTLPDEDMVKGVLNNGIAQDTIQPAQIPLTNNDQSSVLQPNTIQQVPQQMSMMLDSSVPQLALPASTPAVTAQDNQNVPVLSQLPGNNGQTQQLPLDKTLLYQILGSGKSQSKIDRKHTNPTSMHSSFNNDLTTFQDGPLNPGVTSSMRILPVPLRTHTILGDSLPPSINPGQTLRRVDQQLQPPIQQSSQPQFEDEYKYDKFDGQRPYKMKCRDLSDECEHYATDGSCDEFAPLSSLGEVKTMCRKSCGLCDDENSTETKKKSNTRRRKND